MLKKGREQLQVLMGGRGGPGKSGGGDQGEGPRFGRGAAFGIGFLAIIYWVFASFYQVQNFEKSVELFLGEYYQTGDEGLNFAPWPVVTYEIIPVDREQTEDAYANRVLAQARGESAQMMEEAEGYRARVVNEATGEASRFSAVLEEYIKAPKVTRKRLYIETMEEVLENMEKVI